MDSSIILTDNIRSDSRSIFLYPGEIIIMHNVCYGRVYLKVRSKKFFTKYSDRVFFMDLKKICFWKMKNGKRVKFKTFFFNIYYRIGGLRNIFDKYGRGCFEFDIYSRFNTKNLRIFTFRSYNGILFLKLYSKLEEKIIRGYCDNVL